jgi:hypothetical protein
VKVIAISMLTAKMVCTAISGIQATTFPLDVKQVVLVMLIIA